MMQVTFKNDEPEIPAVCPVCKTQGAVPRLRVEGVERAEGHLDMCECKDCGTYYFNSENPVTGYSHPDFEKDYWLNYVQSGAGIVGMLEPLLAVADKEQHTLLDIGCGFGFVPHFWESRGYGRAVGLEKSFYGTVGREKLGATIYHANFAEADQITGEKFDYVYSCEVLEHVRDPAAFVDEISLSLAENGILILTTPCANAIKPDTSPRDTLEILSPGLHYFVTSEKALRNLLQDRGFAHVHIHNSGTRLFAWASCRPLPHIEPGFRHWDDYFGYLQALSRNADPHVANGALYRLVKDSVNLGQLVLTKDSIDHWGTLALSTYGLDFLNPQEIESRFMALTEPRYEEFPSWLGCGLLFYVRSVTQMGGKSRLMIPAARAAVAIMKREVEQFAQFAGEPAHFLPLAQETLRELEQMPAALTASDIRPQFVRNPELGKSLRGRAACLLCGWAPDGRPSPALVALCQAMVQHNIDVHVCLAVAPSVRSVFTSELEGAATIAFRQNDSYDFGMWSAQLAALPDIWEANRIIFANDSVLLIKSPAFSTMMDELKNDETDFIALTESHSPRYHTQSYFFQMRGAALRDWRLRRFWAEIPSKADKPTIIRNYELGLIDAVQQNCNLRTRVLFDYKKLFPNLKLGEAPEGNPTHILWERLLLKGMPFVKAELLHSNPLRMPLKHWSFALRAEGADLEMIDRHLREMDRTRKGNKNQNVLNTTLKGLLGEKQFRRLREWNKERLLHRRTHRKL